jgi:hypothetical protein
MRSVISHTLYMLFAFLIFVSLKRAVHHAAFLSFSILHLLLVWTYTYHCPFPILMATFPATHLYNRSTFSHLSLQCLLGRNVIPLKLEAASASETLVSTYKPWRCQYSDHRVNNPPPPWRFDDCLNFFSWQRQTFSKSLGNISKF